MQNSELVVKEKTSFALVIALFFLSGFSSLIYQVVWTRMLVFVFGSTTFATSTVLTVFMGGLALGAYLAGRVSDGLKRPFLWYGILEGVIGFFALLVPSMFDAAIPLYKVIWQNFHLSVIPFSLLRFSVVTFILLIPTTCMGATLPILSRFITANLSSVGNKVGTLYSINTLGAVVGTLAGGFFLLPLYGLKIATVLAALINFLLLLIVFVTHKKAENKTAYDQMDDQVIEDGESSPKIILATMIAFAVSGAVAMIYEVGWTRTLLMIIGSSTYAFSIMLSTFLVGIFWGSLICARYIDRCKNPVYWFAAVELALCLVSFVAMNQCNYLPFLNLIINAYMANNPYGALIVRFLLASMVLLPITICLGAIFPIAVKIYATNLKSIGRSIGNLYTANTVGAIIGAFLAGFVMIPLFGSERSLVLASAINLVLGIWLLMYAPSIRKSLKIFCAVAGLFVFCWAVNSAQVWDRVIILSAQKERRWQIVEPDVLSNFSSWVDWKNSLYEGSRVLFWKDGACSTVGVLGYLKSKTRALLTNGHVDASDRFDMHTQVLLAAYPLLFKPEAQDVAVIGWGSGVTIGVASCFPVKSILGIEIEPAVIEAAKYFNHVNEEPDKNPLVVKEFNDGRNYLLATDKDFDVIISEPSNPWQAGVCNLFTEEFFSICSKRLKKGGVFSLWLQLSEVSPSNVQRVLAALQSVFSNILPIYSDDSNLVVLASNEPIKLSYAQAQKLFKEPRLAKQLEGVDINDLNDLLAQVAFTPDSARKLTAGIKGNGDDRNILEYEVGKTYESKLYSSENVNLLDSYGDNLWDAVDWSNMNDHEKAQTMEKVAASAVKMKHYGSGLKWAEKSLAIEKSPEAYRICGIAEIEKGDFKKGLSLLNQGLVLDSKNINLLQTIGMAYLQKGENLSSRPYFEQVLNIQPNNKVAHFRLAQSYMLEINDTMPAKQKLEAANISDKNLTFVINDKQFIERHPETLFFGGTAARIIGKNDIAKDLLEHYLELRPQDVIALRQLGVVLYSLGMETESAACWNQSFHLGASQSNRLVTKAKGLLNKGRTTEALNELAIALDLFPTNTATVSLLDRISRNDKIYGARASEILMRIKTPFIDKR